MGIIKVSEREREREKECCVCVCVCQLEQYLQRDMKELFKVMEMFYILTVVVVSWLTVHIYHWIVYLTGELYVNHTSTMLTEKLQLQEKLRSSKTRKLQLYSKINFFSW